MAISSIYVGDVSINDVYRGATHVFSGVILPPTWEFIGVAGVVSSTSGDLVLEEKSGVLEGDLEVVCIPYRGNALFAAAAGWTEAVQLSSGNTSTDPTTSISSVAIFWRVRGASAGDLTFTRTGGDIARTKMLTYRPSRGVPSAIAAGGATAASNSTSVTMNGLVTTAENALVVVCLSGADNVSLVDPGIESIDPTTSSGTTEFPSTETITPDAWKVRMTGNSALGADQTHILAGCVKSSIGSTGNITGHLSVASRHSIAAATFQV